MAPFKIMHIKRRFDRHLGKVFFYKQSSVARCLLGTYAVTLEMRVDLFHGSKTPTSWKVCGGIVSRDKYDT